MKNFTIASIARVFNCVSSFPKILRVLALSRQAFSEGTSIFVWKDVQAIGKFISHLMIITGNLFTVSATGKKGQDNEKALLGGR